MKIAKLCVTNQNLKKVVYTWNLIAMSPSLYYLTKKLNQAQWFLDLV